MNLSEMGIEELKDNQLQLSNYLNNFSEIIHNQNVEVGWWDEGPDRCIFTVIQLIVTEIAEATEGARKDLMDDKLPKYKMEEVELADTLIRLLDLGGFFGLKVSGNEELVFSVYNNLLKNNSASPGFLHLVLVRFAINLTDEYSTTINTEVERRKDENETTKANAHASYTCLQEVYSIFCKMIVLVAKVRGYDFFNAFEEKHAFNSTRQDHKRETRAAANGKKF